MNVSALPPLRFDAPWLLLAAVLLPVVVWWLRAVRQRQRRDRLARFADPSALPRLVQITDPDERGRTRRLMLVVLLAGAALAGPRWGLARGPVSARGIDMAIAIDASLSMMAPDERPNRLERVKQEVRRLRAMSQADRVALIAFAGRSYILTPLTSDDGAIELFLDNLDPSVVGQAGSSLARAIRQGTELLLASDGSADRALVLMTDGEAFDSIADVQAAATEAGTKGISLVTVGFGTTAGSTIPVQDGSVTRDKRDDEGNVVITRYTPALLEAAATAANGTFIPADASDKATRVRGALRALRTARRQLDAREDHVPRFRWLLLPALLLLLYDTWRLNRRRAPRAPRAATLPPAALTLWLAALPLSLLSCTQPPDPAVLFAEGNVGAALAAYRAQFAAGDTTARTRYNLGTALLGADSLPEGAELLDVVRRDGTAEDEVRYRARFNAGYAALQIGRTPGTPAADASVAAASFAAARAAYRALLADRPGDADAKWNYELALRAPPPPQGGGGGGGAGKSPDEQPDQKPQDQGGLDQRQAEALLNSAAREERDVQGRKQRQGRTPPGGKDW
ncbi:MAG: VWA domain-containing protein [Gemmatimonadota bacterium]|nr:VWA domain-containing protein [Gemmatimonadota bacterium]MDQ8168341.1 VWA domain-containing protein [Gemmatimonadota bacterium]MDQ8173197.1 VWA domain-containing protein [Gemmatimonadota bacterium]